MEKLLNYEEEEEENGDDGEGDDGEGEGDDDENENEDGDDENEDGAILSTNRNPEQIAKTSDNPWLNYFKNNYIAPYNDGYNSYFRRGKIVEIIDFINKKEGEAYSEYDLKMQEDIEKVKALGCDILSPFVKYWSQSKVLHDKMREVRDYLSKNDKMQEVLYCLAQKKGEKRTRYMDVDIDISYDGIYQALLRILKNDEFKEIVSISYFTNMLTELQKEMNLLIELKDGILTKSDEYKRFEKAAMEFVETSKQCDKLEG